MAATEAPEDGTKLVDEVDRLQGLVCRACGDGRGWHVQPMPDTGEPMQVRCEECDWRARAERAEAQVGRVQALIGHLPDLVKDDDGEDPVQVNISVRSVRLALDEQAPEVTF